MSEKREWVGITENMCYFVGRVVEDPYFYDNNGKENALVKVKTIRPERRGDQWVDAPIVVPLYAVQDNNVNTLHKHVKKGRQLKALCSYKNWPTGNGSEGHGFFIERLGLGDKPFEKREDNNTGGYNNLPPG